MQDLKGNALTSSLKGQAGQTSSILGEDNKTTKTGVKASHDDDSGYSDNDWDLDSPDKEQKRKEELKKQIEAKKLVADMQK
jgi:hypothetical protein